MVLLNDYFSKSYHKIKYSRNCNVSVNVNVEPTPVNINCNNSSNAEDRINKILIEFYARLYNEVIISINEFLSLVKENDTDKLIEIFTAEYFACLVAKIYAIKIDLTKEFEDYNPFPNSVTLFINNYVNTLFLIVDTFKNNIRIMKDNERLLVSHEILQSLDSIKEYINRNFNDTDSNIITLTASAKLTVGIEVMEPYRTYFATYGEDSFPINSENLAAIQYQLDQNIICNT